MIVETGGSSLLFGADHALRHDWFEEDCQAGRPVGLGIWDRRSASETTVRMRRFVEERDALLLPSHDLATPERLQAALGHRSSRAATAKISVPTSM